MTDSKTRIAVVAPASAIKRETAEKVSAICQSRFGGRAELYFHPQCFHSSGHFAGTDAERSQAFLDVANDAQVDAVWFARGGYGSCRLDERLFSKLNDAARGKTYLGYSDLGALLARLYAEGVGTPVHGPMPQDIMRAGGDGAIGRALAFLVDHDQTVIEPSAKTGAKSVAFNIMILAHLIGAPWAPDLADHVILLEEIAEHHYRIDRALCAIVSNPKVRKSAGIMLGRCRDIPENDPAFGDTEEEIAQYWCGRAGIPYLGRADIGHDADNKIVPFGGGLLV